MDCTKTAIFLAEWSRMCYSSYDCSNCPLANEFENINCDMNARQYPEKFINLVQNWSDDHPIKTRQSEFLKLFPKSKLEKGVLLIRPCVIEGECINLDKHECGECREDYWLTEVE